MLFIPTKNRAQRLSASEIQQQIKSATKCNSCYCAQRLSASEIQHYSPQLYAYREAYVLNAFRHQRFNTAGANAFLSKQISAQRLSASEIQHSAEIS